MASKWEQYSEQELQNMINQVESYSSLMKLMGYCGTGGNNTIVIRKIKQKYPHLDFSHFTNQGWRKNKTVAKDGIHRYEKYTIEEIFCEDSPVAPRVIKTYVLRHNLIPYKCNCCGFSGKWMGYELVLQLHHINGNNTDNRLENLMFLCPNCHSITENFAGRGLKNKKEKTIISKETKTSTEYFCIECGKKLAHKCNTGMCQECYKKSIRVVERPDAITLALEVLENGYAAVGRKYGVTDNAIRKWCKAYNIPTNKKEMLNWVKQYRA